MKRREFITLVGCTAAAWPPMARAQEATAAVVGWLSIVSPEGSPALPYFREGLSDLGYREGRNLRIEYRWARYHPELLHSLSVDLVRSGVSVIAAVSGAPSAIAAQAATSTIPIVFITPGDPVQQGLVTSLNRPGGNLTGLTMTNTSLLRKQIELLHELLPGQAPLAILSVPDFEPGDLESNARQAGQVLGRSVMIVEAASEQDFETALAKVLDGKAGGLVVPDRPTFIARHEQLAAAVSRYGVPTIYPPANLARSGGLMSYGASTLDVFRRAGQYVGKILQGAKPAELPVEQPTKITLQINLKAAKALGLTIPPSLLVRADEVIE